MLIYAVSFEFQLPACIVVHNHCLNTMLAAPVYFSNGAVCPELFNQKIDIDAKMRIGFKIDAIENKSECALLFKLEGTDESDDQHSIDTSATETDENEATHVHMLVVWEVKDAKPFAYVVLVEHTKEFNWDEDKLNKLYYENHDRLKKHNDTISNTWFMDDNMILKTKFKVKDSKGNPKLSIYISEGKENAYAKRPFCINLKR
jgi:hypothetical protein